MFGIGETELVIIVVFAFMLFGPDKLPGMGRTIGRALRQFREAQEGFTQVVQAEVVDPMTSAINEPGKKRAVSQDALDDDADIEGSEGASHAAKGETFAERKARLKAEREAREAAEAAAAEAAAAEAEGAGIGGDEDADLPGGAQNEAAADTNAGTPDEAAGDKTEEPVKQTSAAALYAMAPRTREKKGAGSEGAAKPEGQEGPDSKDAAPEAAPASEDEASADAEVAAAPAAEAEPDAQPAAEAASSLADEDGKEDGKEA